MKKTSSKSQKERERESERKKSHAQRQNGESCRDSVGQFWPSMFHPCASSEVVLRESLQHGPYIVLPQVSAASDLVTC